MSLLGKLLHHFTATGDTTNPVAAPQRDPAQRPPRPLGAEPPQPAQYTPSKQDLQRIIAAPVPGPGMPYKRYPNLPGSDQQELARFGRTVRARLEPTAAAHKLPAQSVDMFLVRGFLSDDECRVLVQLIDQDVKPSTVLRPGSNDGIRTSQTCKLSASHPLVAEVERRMTKLLGLPLSHSETVQGQRYQVGQQFKMHNDYFAGGQPYSEAVAKEGGQRTWTAMVFLNKPEAGGCTSFPRAGVQVAPETGALLTWNNNDKAGLSNPYTHHEGMAVEAGVKYILTKWFREREWHTSAGSDALRV